MSTKALKEVVSKSMRDEQFLDQLLFNTEKTLEKFNLSDKEKEVIISGNENQLNKLLGLGEPSVEVGNHRSINKGPVQKPDLLARQTK